MWWTLPLPVLVWALAAWQVHRVGRRAPRGDRFDAVVVAGCPPLPDGSPSPALRRRVLAAVDLLREGRAPLLVCTGADPGHGHAEAEVAARLARDLGHPSEHIRVEARSRSTHENAVEVKALLGRDARVLVVTDAWHAARCLLVFRRHFAQVEVHGAPTPSGPHLRGLLREPAAILLYAARGRIGPRQR